MTVQITENTLATRTLEPLHQEDVTFGIEQKIIDRALRFDKPSNQVIRRKPRSATYSVRLAGVVREIRPKVDPYKQLRVDRTAFGAAMLGELSQPIWGRLTVHVPDGDGVGSYTVWIESNTLDDFGLRRGDCVEFHAAAQSVPMGRDNLEWFLQEMRSTEGIKF